MSFCLRKILLLNGLITIPDRSLGPLKTSRFSSSNEKRVAFPFIYGPFSNSSMHVKAATYLSPFGITIAPNSSLPLRAGFPSLYGTINTVCLIRRKGCSCSLSSIDGDRGTVMWSSRVKLSFVILCTLFIRSFGVSGRAAVARLPGWHPVQEGMSNQG